MRPNAPADFYRLVFDNNTLDGVAYCQMIFDAQENPIDFIYREVNKIFTDLTGLKNVVGKKVTKLIPDIKVTNPELFEIYGRVSLTGKPERFETYVEPLSRWFLISAYSSKKGFFVAVFQNITGRKQIQKDLEDASIAARNVLEDLETEKNRVQKLAKELEKFKMAVAGVSEHIIITDRDGTIMFVNPAAERLTGFTKSEILGKKAGAKELWGGLMNEEFYPKLWHTIKIEKKSFSGEIKNRRNDGQEYYAHATISPILGRRGEVEFFIDIERDVTKEREIDKAKSEFVSLASHQLRTPTTSIRWYSEMLLEEDVGTLNDKQKEYLKEIHHGNQRMIELVNTLLSVSRIELGTFAVKPEPTNIILIADDVLGELQTKIKEKELDLERAYENDTCIIKSDPKLIRIIFQNLLSNAVTYTPPKGKISIVLKKISTGVHVEVCDSGYGIPKSAQPNMYTKFFRADNARIVHPDGTGLGLYITKSIVQALGGSIDFKSKEGEGTIFSVNIPAQDMARRKPEKTLT